MAELNIADQINKKIQESLKKVTTTLKAVRQELKMSNLEFGQIRFEPVEGLGDYYMTPQRWEDLGKPDSIEILIIPGEKASDAPSAAVESVEYLEFVKAIYPTMARCVHVEFVNGRGLCSKDTPYYADLMAGIPSLRDLNFDDK